jgi:hypothetical protein
LATSAIEQAPTTNANGSMKDKVDYQFHEMDAEVSDMLWCGTANENILVKTKEGSVYRSRDKGGNWKKLHGEMKRHASTVVSND